MKGPKKLCYNCMNEIHLFTSKCPYCTPYKGIQYFNLKTESLFKAYNNNEIAAIERVKTLLKNSDNVTLQCIQNAIAIESGFLDWNELINASSIELDLAIVMDKKPLLNDFGIGVRDRQKSINERMQILEQNRKNLRQSISDVTWTVSWLNDNIKPIKTINPNYSSYGLKHIAEKSSPKKYLTNGVFIASAIIAGYPYKMFYNSPNVAFGMSERSIKMVIRKLNNWI